MRAQGAASGSIQGQISNAATSSNLEGVRIHVAGTAIEVLSERDGSYQITGLPAGTHTLSFEYPGLDRKQVVVEVGSTGRARQDVQLSSGVYVLEKFTVASEREGNAAAIVAQRNSVNVQNVITADAFGNIAKGNVGDFLKRIPGIAGTTDEVDTENIVLRGMGANFTSLDIDGTRSSSGGTSRGQSAASIPTDMIERVEVIKSPTPDVDADSLGGRINLVTKSAYDRQGRRITLRAASSYSFTYGSDVGRGSDSAFAPSFATSFSDVFSVFGGERNLGVHVGGNWERILDVRGTTSWGDNYTTVNGVEYPRFNNVSVALHGNDRGGGNLRADYKFSRELSFGASASFNTYSNRMYRTRNQLKNGTARPALSGDPYLVVIDGANYGTERSTRDQTTNRLATRLYGTYKGASGLRIDADLNLQRSTQSNYAQFFNATSNRKIDYALDRREGFADARWPALRIISAPYTGTTRTTTALPSAFLDVNPFGDDFIDTNTTSGLQWQRIFAKNEIVRSKIDVTKKFSLIEVKTGASYRGESVKTSRDDLRGQINLTGYGRDLRPLLDNTWDLGGAIGRYPVGYVIDIDKVTQAMGISYAGAAADPIQRWNFNPAVFQIDNNSTRQNTLQNTRKIWEHVYASYLQGTVKFGRLTLLGGARVEHTENVRNQAGRNRAASGTLAEWTDRKWSDASYTNYYPSVHSRYALAPNLVLHASFGTTSGRPNWGQILGVTDANEINHTINVPNLELKPRTSKNYDLSLEYYFEPVGVISVGVFQKDIKNYDVSAEWQVTAQEAIDLGAQPAPGDTTPWLVTSRLNAGFGRVRGIELNYSQSLSKLLPGPFRGLGVFSNFTYLQTEGTFDNAGTAGAPPVKTNRLQGFIPRTANAGLSYLYNRYDLRVSWNYTDDWPENTPSNPATTKVRGERWSLDFTGKYRVTRNITFFADMVNLTSNHGKKYRGYVDPALRNETNALGFLLTAGVQATF